MGVSETRKIQKIQCKVKVLKKKKGDNATMTAKMGSSGGKGDSKNYTPLQSLVPFARKLAQKLARRLARKLARIQEKVLVGSQRVMLQHSALSRQLRERG